MAAAAVGHHFAIPLLISNFPPSTLTTASYSSSSPIIFTTNSNFHYSRLLSSVSPILSFSVDTRQRHFRHGKDCYCFGQPSHIISATPSHHSHPTLESTSFEQEEEKEVVVEEEPEAPFSALSTTSLPFRPTLTVKEKKELASYAHTLGKKLKVQQVGKSGVTPSVAASFVENLECNELLKCDPSDPRSCDAGCNGGLMTTAFEYILQAGGLEREEDYPYTGKDGTCKFDKSKIAASASNFTVISTDEDQIAANLVKYGPLAVGINAAFMQTYIGGVSCPYICFKNYLDHGVTLVGYGAAGYAPIRLKNKPYWIIKNSWGASWGEDGYYRICRGNNICGVDSMVSSVAAASKI